MYLLANIDHLLQQKTVFFTRFSLNQQVY